ncbi:MAG TPA: glycosyltransferase family 9 protein [Flavisolibacter sp.]|nr:glycosyltransferase family 9 protein [Flavisolibacter sp.]
MAFYRKFHWKWIAAADRFFIIQRRRKSGVVIVRLDAIGDFVVWSHSAPEYRQLFPGQKITLIANVLWKGLAEKLPYWDEVWAIDPDKFKKNLVYRWKWLYRISRAGFEVALHPTFSRRLLIGDTMIRASQARKRVGPQGDLSNMSEGMRLMANEWYTELVHIKKEASTELERNAAFVHHLSGRPVQVKLHRMPSMGPLPSNLVIERDYFIIFPGASWPGRQWPAAHFASLVRQLNEKTGWIPVLCGSEGEKEFCSSIGQQSGVYVINLAGATNLCEFTEVIRRSRLLVGNETSAIHIAAAVQTPVVCITGGGHFGRFVPYPEMGTPGMLIASYHMPCYHCNWSCTQGYNGVNAVPCIREIPVSLVLKLSLEALSAQAEVGRQTSM